MNFWHTLPQPIIGLAPMDGVTDAAFRCIVARHGKPDVQYTEFTDVEQIYRGTTPAWRQLRFSAMERPVVAQIYGANPQRFYQAAHIICTLGFDGVDINMGCPAKNVATRGCGAALIKNPALAGEIIGAVQAGVRDWAAGHTLDTIGLPPEVLAHVQRRAEASASPAVRPRTPIPVSIKTRLGYDTVVSEDWMTVLLDARPDVIALHGRTLAQKYRGQADWHEIGRAAKLAQATSTLVLGNGDLRTMAEVVEQLQATPVHGVLIGRGALGNPWIFLEKDWVRQCLTSVLAPAPPPEVAVHERLQVALEHARYFETLNHGPGFPAMRKHLGWYCRGFPGAAEMRTQLFQATSAADVARLLAEVLHNT